MFSLVPAVRFLPLLYFLSAEPVASSTSVAPLLKATTACQEINSVLAL